MKRKRIVRNTSEELSKKPNGMQQSDNLALEKTKEALSNSKNDTEQKILEITLQLMGQYSFAKYQTYPRPSHPEASKRSNIYITMVAILISLRTTLENEERAVDAFMKKFKIPQDVLNSDIEEISEIIKVAGMPTKKATAIMDATKYVVEVLEEDWGQFLEMDIDKAREEIMKIPGVGQKTADCLLELGLDLPTIVIDTNMFRVVSRIFGMEWAESPDFSSKKQIQGAKDLIEDNLAKNGFVYQIVHTMLLLHGKNVCRSNPSCSKCQFVNRCKFLKNRHSLDDYIK